MKKIQIILVLLLAAYPTIIIAQSDQKLKERQERRVDTVFSDDEKNSVQLWYYENMKRMNLDQETEDIYTSIVNSNIYKMRRLDDKDSELSSEEIRDGVDMITKDMNSKIQPLLSKENYKIHETLFNDLLKMVYEKEGWEWKEK